MAASVFTLPIRPAKYDGLVAQPTYHAPEAAAQTYEKGALLISSSGKVATAGADPALETLIGVANHNSTGTTDTDVEYIPALPHITFEGTFSSGGTGVALLQSDLWVAYGVAVDATTKVWYVDKADTTNIRVVIVGFRDAVGTTDARVYFKFIPEATVYAPQVA